MILTYQDIEIPTKKRSSRIGKERMRVAQQLVTDGIQEGQLRDEIFCQLCKQTCEAPERYPYHLFFTSAHNVITFEVVVGTARSRDGNY